jgi:hypothetical protein
MELDTAMTPMAPGVVDLLAGTADSGVAREAGNAIASALLDAVTGVGKGFGVLGPLPSATRLSLAEAGHQVYDVGDPAAGSGIEDGSLDVLIVTDPGTATDPLAVLAYARRVLRPEAKLCVAGVFCRRTTKEGPSPTPLLETWTPLAERGGFVAASPRELSSQVLAWLDRIAAATEKEKEERHLAVAALRERIAEGRDGFFVLQFTVSTGPRWTVARAGVQDFAELSGLFENVFGHSQSPAMWAWKYGDGSGHNLIVRRDGVIVAHCGGVVRRLSYFGRPCLGVALCDVMVTAAERGVLTRKGAIFQVTAAFLELFVGYGRPYLVAFGFPTWRSNQLGVRLGMYRCATRMTELAWRPARAWAHLTTRVRALQPELDGAVVDALWAQMRGDLSEAVAGVRDWAYVRRRYLEHPEFRYQLFLVSRRFGGRPCGVLILRFDGQRCELLDLVGPLGAIPLLVSQARGIAARMGAKELFTWVSVEFAEHFSGGRPQQRTSDLVVPANAWTPGPAAEEVDGRMWLTSGDTDFR